MLLEGSEIPQELSQEISPTAEAFAALIDKRLNIRPSKTDGWELGPTRRFRLGKMLVNRYVPNWTCARTLHDGRYWFYVNYKVRVRTQRFSRRKTVIRFDRAKLAANQRDHCVVNMAGEWKIFVRMIESDLYSYLVAFRDRLGEVRIPNRQLVDAAIEEIRRVNSHTRYDIIIIDTKEIDQDEQKIQHSSGAQE